MQNPYQMWSNPQAPGNTGVAPPPWMSPFFGQAAPPAQAPPVAPKPGPLDPSMFFGMASPSFIGLQGLPTDFNPASVDFNQLSMLLGLTSGAPDRIDDFQNRTHSSINRLGASGARAIDRGAAQRYASQANQIGYTQRQNQRQQGDAFAAMGLAPSVFQANVVPQQRMDLSALLGQARGATSADATAQHQQLREQQFDRRTGLNQASLNARNELEQYYDSLLLQKYMAEIAAQAQMSAAGKSAKASKFGDILGIGGSILGGPIGGAIGKFLGGIF